MFWPFGKINSDRNYLSGGAFLKALLMGPVASECR